MERMIGLFKKNFSKKRKGFSFMEVLLALVLIVAMSVGAFFALNTAQQTRKMAQMNNDMDAIVNGLLAYEQLNINGSLPATLQACSAGLTAAQSIDGASHTNLLKWTKSTTAANAPGTAAGAGSFVDPWGQAYGYDSSARTVTCTPKDASGTAMATVTRYF